MSHLSRKIDAKCRQSEQTGPHRVACRTLHIVGEFHKIVMDGIDGKSVISGKLVII